jgi:dTDP-4-amino-4,6-dideoxygalactose transaminase
MQGYRAEDFPKTESLIHRFVVIPVGMRHTLADMDYIGEAVRRIARELGLS